MATRPKRKLEGSVQKTRVRRATAVIVTDEERQHLIDAIAYFHAERYRRIEPGQGRSQDRRDAEVEIKAVLKRKRKR